MSKKFIFSFIISLFLFSCSNDDEFSNSNQGQDQLQQKMVFKYKDVTYSSFYYLMNDSIIFENKQVQNVYNNLESLPELISYQFENGMLQFFEDNHEFNQYLNHKYSKSKTNKRTTIMPQYISGEINLYENALSESNKGKSFSYGFSNQNSNGTWETVFQIPDFRSMPVISGPLLPENFNDQLTGFRASLHGNTKGVILHVRIYENCFFKGKSKIFETQDSDISVNTLYQHKMKGRKSWDDEVSSIAVKLLVPSFNF